MTCTSNATYMCANDANEQAHTHTRYAWYKPEGNWILYRCCICVLRNHPQPSPVPLPRRRNIHINLNVNNKCIQIRYTRLNDKFDHATNPQFQISMSSSTLTDTHTHTHQTQQQQTTQRYIECYNFGKSVSPIRCCNSGVLDDALSSDKFTPLLYSTIRVSLQN